MAAKRDDTNPTDQLLDFFVYAPVGIALEAVDNLPKYIERGRSQVTLGRFVARAAAKKSTSTLESLGERLVQEAGQVVVDLFGIDLTPDVTQDDLQTAADTSASSSQRAQSDDDLPIPDYDSQAASQIVKLLSQLTADERAEVAAYEQAGRNRVTILRKIDQLRASE